MVNEIEFKSEFDLMLNALKSAHLTSGWEGGHKVVRPCLTLSCRIFFSAFFKGVLLYSFPSFPFLSCSNTLAVSLISSGISRLLHYFAFSLVPSFYL